MGYAAFCKARKFKQTSKGLRYVYTKLMQSLDESDGFSTDWYNLCYSIAERRV